MTQKKYLFFVLFLNTNNEADSCSKDCIVILFNLKDLKPFSEKYTGDNKF